MENQLKAECARTIAEKNLVETIKENLDEVLLAVKTAAETGNLKIEYAGFLNDRGINQLKALGYFVKKKRNLDFEAPDVFIISW